MTTTQIKDIISALTACGISDVTAARLAGLALVLESEPPSAPQDPWVVGDDIANTIANAADVAGLGDATVERTNLHHRVQDTVACFLAGSEALARD